MESIPVFAQNMAVRVLAELGDVRGFSNLNKISVFIGIDRERY
ncbi:MULTISPECIES: transposase [Lactobacillus]|nr:MULTISPECIES: transposase [Lactobacillus]